MTTTNTMPAITTATKAVYDTAMSFYRDRRYAEFLAMGPAFLAMIRAAVVEQTLNVGDVIYTADMPEMRVASIETEGFDQTVTITQDGVHVYGGWHQGPQNGESVYYERYTRDGRVAHGYADPVSRRVVQTG